MSTHSIIYFYGEQDKCTGADNDDNDDDDDDDMVLSVSFQHYFVILR